MGRSLFVDETVQTYIEQLVKANKWFTGVIIGQVTSHRDYVVHIARTPDPVEDEVVEENGENDNEEIAQKPKQTVVRPSSIEQLDEKWVSTHAKQVSWMLPGGLSVIGLFAVAPTNMLQASQIKLKQMMYSVHKNLTKSFPAVSSSEITDRILLQIDSTTRKLTCSSLDVADAKSSPRPAEWKYQPVSSQWARLDSQLSVDVPMAVCPQDRKTQTTLLRQLQIGLSDFCQSVRQAVVTIDDAIRDGAEPLVAPMEQQQQRKGKKGGKDRGRGDAPENSISKVQIFLPLPSSGSLEDPVHNESPTALRMCGTITVRAFVPPRATVADAIEAVKTDIIKSLLARCELLCEEDDVTEDKEDSAVYDPPVRHFCATPNPSVHFCDYAFQDEKQEEVTQRIQELLDFSVRELEHAETNATEEDTWTFLAASESGESDDAQSCHKEEPVSSGLVKAYLGAAIGGLVAVVASGLSYLYLSE